MEESLLVRLQQLKSAGIVVVVGLPGAEVIAFTVVTHSLLELQTYAHSPAERSLFYTKRYLFAYHYVARSWKGKKRLKCLKIFREMADTAPPAYVNHIIAIKQIRNLEYVTDE